MIIMKDASKFKFFAIFIISMFFSGDLLFPTYIGTSFIAFSHFTLFLYSYSHIFFEGATLFHYSNAFLDMYLCLSSISYCRKTCPKR